MKNYLKKIISLSLSVLIIASGAASAAPEASYNIKAPNNILVTGSAAIGSPVGIKAMSNGELEHIGMAVCDEYGKYSYKFATEASAESLILSVSQNGNSAETTAIAQKIGDLYIVELDIVDGAGDKYHFGADNKCTVRATVVNNYGGGDSYSLIAAMYDENGTLIGTVIKDGNMKYAKNGEIEIISNDIVPGDCAAIKAFMWDNTGNITPLATSVERVKSESFAADKLITEDGKINAAYSGDIKVSYLGGSITEGTGANPRTNSFVSLTTNGIKEMYPNAKVTEINAGIGGTGSNSGYMRLETDVLDYNPDIVFLEYAVNDATNHEFTVYYEGIIRRLLRMEKQPVIIALYSAIDHPGTVNAGTANEKVYTTIRYEEVCKDSSGQNIGRPWLISAKSEESKVAEHYGIGEIDFDAEMERIYETGVQVLPEYFIDNVHYNNDGHKLCADFILDTIRKNPSGYFKKINTEKAPLLGTGGFDKPEMIMANDARITYEGEWTTSSSGDMVAPAEGGSITFKFKGTSFGISGDLRTGGRGGAAYSIDGGKYVGNVISAQNGAYGETVTRKTNFFRLTDLVDCEHTVTITAAPFSEEEGRFRFGFIVTD